MDTANIKKHHQSLPYLSSQVIQIAKEAGRFVAESQQKIKNLQIEVKSKNSLVTEVDKTSEQIIVKKLIDLLPEAGFITEEGTIHKKSEDLNWIIDPLDGTTNFLHGIPCFCVSIALISENQLLLGVIYEINLDECFHAYLNGGAFLNEKKIEVTKEQNLENTLVATGFPYYNFEFMDQYLKVMETYMQTTRGIRRLGSACADLAYLACGRFDCFYEYGLNPWDVAAGSIIVSEAGGTVSDFEGGINHIFGNSILATNKATHQKFLQVIQDHNLAIS